MKWKCYFDTDTHPYIVEADNKESAIQIASDLYFQESGKNHYFYSEAIILM